MNERLRAVKRAISEARSRLNTAETLIDAIAKDERGDGTRAPAPPAPAQLVNSLPRLYERGGIVHEPTRGRKVFKGKFRAPANLRRLTLDLTVKTGDDLYLTGAKFFWLGVRNMRNLFGFAIVRRRHLILRAGFGMKIGPDKMRKTDGLPLQPRTVYLVRYSFEDGRVELTVTDPAGRLLARCAGKCPGRLPDTSEITVTLGGDDSEVEPAQYGWQFRDLRIGGE